MSTLTNLADTLKDGVETVKEKANWDEIEEVVQDTTKNVVNATSRFVRENPWKAAGLAAIVGLTIAVCIKNCLQERDERSD